jgi:hypothetical protein
LNKRILEQIQDLILKCLSAKEENIPMLISAQLEDKETKTTLQVYLLSTNEPEEMKALLGYEKQTIGGEDIIDES